jgi:hypothetical protein
MKASRISRGHMIVLVAGILIGSLLVGTSVALTDTAFKYTHAKTGYLSVSSMDFAPDSLQGATNDYVNAWDGSLSNSALGRCFNAGVNLPQGAKMTQITFYYQSDATSDLGGYLVRRNPASGSGTYAVTSTPADNSNIATSVTAAIPLNYRTINNKKYAYGVGVCLETEGTLFNGARITYTYTNAGS